MTPKEVFDSIAAGNKKLLAELLKMWGVHDYHVLSAEQVELGCSAISAFYDRI